MRTLLIVAALATSAYADEVIEIHDRPVEPAKQTSRNPRLIPPYSDEAVASNSWSRAWLLLDIDSTGFVTRLKVLNAPGHDLDAIAISHAFHTRFTPAHDRGGNPVHSQLVWGLEWPSYWWLFRRFGTTAKLPHFGGIADVKPPPCSGSGPLRVRSMAGAVYRDCSLPSVERASEVAWIYPRAATTNLR
jgi:hypothetical protein